MKDISKLNPDADIDSKLRLKRIDEISKNPVLI